MTMKVLLLEDHPALLELISDHLEQCGFLVDAVGSGQEALALVSNAPYDALILDLGLPDIDGMAVLTAVRARTKGHLPALIITARDALDDRVTGLNAGADDYLVKPFALVELEARLRAVLRRPGVRESTTHACGRLRFNSVTRQVMVADSPLALSRREAALLEELLRAAGRVVIKDVLEEYLYGLDEAVTSNALEATVSRLRRKLEAASAGVIIDTKRGIGYRLIAEDNV
jgi:DNA-binding response OmpR family regulator